jgi:hypothetical protein
MLQVALKNDSGFEDTMCYNGHRLKRFTSLTPALISIISQDSPERRTVEHFLAQEFKKSYDADIRVHYPTLMSVQDETGAILGALGFRFAKSEKLFLEQYLDAPVESLISKSCDKKIQRQDIVEVGNLASYGNGASIFMFTALSAYMVYQGMQYITVTATDFLHRYFSLLGVDSVTLGYADQSRLLDAGESWGTYYDTNPRILAGSIVPAYERLQHHLQIHTSLK